MSNDTSELRVKIISKDSASSYVLHELEGKKYYFHLGDGFEGNYLGQSELASPYSWLVPEGAGVLLTNEGLDFEEGEAPPTDDDPVTYALGVRVMQEYGARWDFRGHYFEDKSKALEAMGRLRFYETFSEWAKYAVIHGWAVPQRPQPCGPDENEEERLGSTQDILNEVSILSYRLNPTSQKKTPLTGKVSLRLLKRDQNKGVS